MPTARVAEGPPGTGRSRSSLSAPTPVWTCPQLPEGLPVATYGTHVALGPYDPWSRGFR